MNLTTIQNAFNMKKFFTYLLAFVAVTTVISCSKSEDGPDTYGPVHEPEITWPSNLNSDRVDITDGLEVKIEVDVPAGIKSFKIAVESKVLNDSGITEIDLIETAAVAPQSAVANGTDITESGQITLEDIVKMILGEGGSPKDKTSYTLDLTELVALVNKFATEESDHKFTITIVDKNGQTATKTMVFHWVAEEKPNTDGHDFTETVNGVSFDMVYVKGGTFKMGATEEQEQYAIENDQEEEFPVHSVTLSNYYIGKFEVTQGLWDALMGTNVSYSHIKEIELRELTLNLSNPPHYNTGDNYPMFCLNWSDIEEFLAKLNELTGKNYQLPTEAQWEYAARGGVKSNRYMYSGGDTVDDVAWYDDNSGSEFIQSERRNRMSLEFTI